MGGSPPSFRFGKCRAEPSNQMSPVGGTFAGVIFASMVFRRLFAIWRKKNGKSMGVLSGIDPSHDGHVGEHRRYPKPIWPWAIHPCDFLP